MKEGYPESICSATNKPGMVPVFNSRTIPTRITSRSSQNNYNRENLVYRELPPKRPLSLPNLSAILTQYELRSKISVRITSCRPISNFPINYNSHNPNNCIKIKTTTSNTFLPSLFISNARSLVKIDELSSIVSNYSADIVVITETWLSNNVDSSVISLNGFLTFRHDRSDGRRGGRV